MQTQILILFVLGFYFEVAHARTKVPKSYVEKPTSTKYSNPGYIKDRKKDAVFRPTLGEDWAERFRVKFHPAWRDQCDPYHCNDYHKPACGLNRDSMRFKWFQSRCHVALHNMCANFRGAIKFDTIEPKWCMVYVQHLRSGCPQNCSEEFKPVCGVSSVDDHVVLFKNQCYFEARNCKQTSMNEYEAVDMSYCKYTFMYSKLISK